MSFCLLFLFLSLSHPFPFPFILPQNTPTRTRESEKRERGLPRCQGETCLLLDQVETEKRAGLKTEREFAALLDVK
jgi:hypothetical protein